MLERVFSIVLHRRQEGIPADGDQVLEENLVGDWDQQEVGEACWEPDFPVCYQSRLDLLFCNLNGLFEAFALHRIDCHEETCEGKWSKY